MSGLLAYFILCSLATIILGSVVLFTNPKSNANRVYFLLCLAGAWWVAVNALSLRSIHDSFSLLILQQITPSSLLGCYFLAFFLSYFPDDKKSLRRYLLYGLLPVLAITVLSFTPLNVKPSDSSPDGYVIGELYPAYLVSITILVFLSVAVMIRNYAKSSSVRRTQFVYLLLGISLATIPSLITGAVLPAFGYDRLSDLAPGFMIFFFGFATIAIVKHRLFNVRLVVARTITYAMVLATFSIIYASIIFAVSTSLPGAGNVPAVQQIVYVVTALFLAFTLQPLKRFFDKFTNKFFYQDAYDPQEFLNELNRAILADVDLEPLLEKASAVVSSNFRNQFTIFGLRETAYSPQRIFGAGAKKFTESDIDRIRKITPHIHDRVIVADEVQASDPALYDIMSRNDVAVIGRLTPTVEYEIEGIGYLVLGPKKSGSPYSKRDIDLVRIISSELVVAIQNALRFEEIEKFSITLQEKVDDATKKLRRSNEKLQAMDETKDEFISMASHQLRTPLTSVKGYISMVLEGDAGELNEMQRKLLDQAFVSSQRMVYLIADLLNVSRLRTGKFVIERTPTNLAEVVEGEMSQLKETAAGRGLKLTYKKPKEFVPLMLDETKIRQVIMNFTDNAIYYTPSGGKIDVSLKETPQSIEFTVTDNGIGVPKSEAHHLFNKFYRAGNARKARPDGTGLGLFMAKKVIVAQGGALIFKTQEGKGSTFGFSFAKEKLKVPEQAAAVSQQ